MKALPRFACLSLLVVMALPAQAEVVAGSTELEIYVGGYFPEDGVLDDELTYGLRFGLNPSERWGFQASLSRYEDEGQVLKAGFDYESWLVDLSAVYHVNPESNSVFAIFGGVGAAFNDVDPAGLGDDDSFTLHLGLAGKFDLSERVYLRLDGRGRLMEESDDIDFETSIAVGFRWGA